MSWPPCSAPWRPGAHRQVLANLPVRVICAPQYPGCIILTLHVHSPPLLDRVRCRHRHCIRGAFIRGRSCPFSELHHAGAGNRIPVLICRARASPCLCCTCTDPPPPPPPRGAPLHDPSCPQTVGKSRPRLRPVTTAPLPTRPTWPRRAATPMTLRPSAVPPLRRARRGHRLRRLRRRPRHHCRAPQRAP